MTRIQIGIDSWIIQDGNYNDFRIGDQARFALEFSCNKHKSITDREKSFSRIKGSFYKIHAQVIFLNKGLWILDFGLLAYQQTPPPKNVKKGDWIEAEIYLGIDPFFYFEEIIGFKGVPDLFYDWIIKEIEMETTPLIETKPKYFERDYSNESYIYIQETSAWNDFGGNAHYILHCKQIETRT